MEYILIKEGDVFSVVTDQYHKRYFQFIGYDQTELNTQVIRVFKTNYPLDSFPDLASVVVDKVDFYAHVILRLGLFMKLWQKIGNVSLEGQADILFRIVDVDMENRLLGPVAVSNNWYIWQMNKPVKYIGKLQGENRKAELGLVISPYALIERMKTGKYPFSYPDFW